MMNETRAIELCLRHRDPVGFEFLVRKYRKEAYWHAVSILGNREDAIDACQESFTRAFKSILKLKTLERFYPWFYRILRNCCLNMISRNRTVLTNVGEVGDMTFVQRKSPSPEQVMVRDEDKRWVMSVLRDLKPEFREILLLKYREKKDYAAISQLMQIPRGTVMSRLYHARKAFRNAFNACRK